MASLASADRGLAALAALLYAGSIALRAVRLVLLSEGRVGRGKALPLTALHAGLGHLLPVRLSDLALVGLLRGYASLPAGEGTGVVILSKLQDLVCLGLVVSAAVAAGAAGSLVPFALISIAAGVAGLAAMPMLLDRAGFVRRIPLVGPGAGRFLENLRSSSSIWRRGRLGFALSAAASLLAWVLKLSMFVALARAVGLVEPPVWQIFFAGAVTDLIMALPVHGLFNLGTAEAGWMAGFTLVGATGDNLVTAGFGVHLIWMSLAIVFMLTSLAFLGPKAPPR